VRLGQRIGLDLPPLEEGRPGDPGLFGPGSEVWRVGRERILLVGGPAALLLQLAHPLVAAGVADHSDFLADPFERLRRTLDATLRISFGDAEQVREAAARVGATHRRVQGTLLAGVGPFSAGTPYRASDPELAMWVHATLVFVAIKTYELFVGHLSWARRERYYGEAGRFARLFGVTDEVLPGTYRSFLGYVRSMEQGEHLAVGDQARSLAVQILHPPVPAVLSVTRPASRAVTAALLPERIRQQFGLRFGIVQRTVVNAVAGSVRGTIRTWPHRLRYWEHYMTASRRTLDSIE
jgi:uncharacterized protein (DUF2236 family)